MSGGFPILGDMVSGTNYGADTSTSGGTTITANASANVKGNWTQLSASVATNIVGLFINIFVNSTAGPAQFGVDIGTGTTGNEFPVIENLICYRDDVASAKLVTSYFFPINIPAGARLAARCQCTQATSQNVRISCIGFDGGFTQSTGGSHVDSIGFVTSTTLGTAVTPSASANTKGSYAELTAATTNDYIGFVLGFDTQNVALTNVLTMLWDIAIGPSGGEIPIIPNFMLWLNAGEYAVQPQSSAFIPVKIPAGTRIAARAQNGVANISGPLGLTLYGVR